MRTRDRDIRSALHDALAHQFKDDPDTIFVDELGLCQGEVRVDVAVVNGLLHGYEIKSDRDTLERLPRQMEVYGMVFDTITIVSGASHVEKICSIIPEWWGIVTVEHSGGGVVLQDVRVRGMNNRVDPYGVAQLLWRDEALEILVELGQDRGVITKPRRYVWERLVSVMPLPHLQHRVREKLKARLRLRSDSPQMSSGD